MLKKNGPVTGAMLIFSLSFPKGRQIYLLVYAIAYLSNNNPDYPKA